LSVRLDILKVGRQLAQKYDPQTPPSTQLPRKQFILLLRSRHNSGARGKRYLILKKKNVLKITRGGDVNSLYG